MNSFDVLFLAFATLALVAVYQLRLCTFILAGNNLLVCRALSAIDRGGPPTSMGFLPEYVFSPSNLSTAAAILTISFVTLVGFSVIPGRERVRIGPNAPRVPRSLLTLLALYLVAYFFANSTIFATAYAAPESRNYDFELAGGHTFLCSLLVYELARRRLLAEITARKAFLIMFGVFFAIGYARGGTGLTTGYLVTCAIMLLPRTGAAKQLANAFRIAVVLMAIFATSFVVRGVRANLASEGTDAVKTFLDGALRMENERNDRAEGAESVANASQSATHMLLTITLYDNGISREWRSIYNVVEYTFVPSFAVRWLGWTRSIEPAWELGDYYLHSGGINVLGEFYWNGGFPCVVIMGTLLSFFCFIVDKYYRASPFWLMMASQFGPSFLMGYGYGFPQVARGAINCLVVAGAYKVFVTVRGQATGLSLRPTSSHSLRGDLLA